MPLFSPSTQGARDTIFEFETSLVDRVSSRATSVWVSRVKKQVRLEAPAAGRDSGYFVRTGL